MYATAVDANPLEGGMPTSGIEFDYGYQDYSDIEFILKPNEKHYIGVMVGYGDVTKQPTDLDAEIKLDLVYQQTGTPTIIPEPETKTVYSWNTKNIMLGRSLISDLESTKTAEPYYESAEEVMDASGYPFFNKYTVVGGIITEGYVCQTFDVLSEPVCVQGGDPAYYNYQNSPGNWSVLNTLNGNEVFTDAGGSCNFDAESSDCMVGGLRLSANIYGEGRTQLYGTRVVTRAADPTGCYVNSYRVYCLEASY